MTKPYKKKLIEVAIPLEAINEAAMKEKSNPFLKGHPRSLHQWWARRPLPTARAVLFAQLVDDPSSHPEKFPSEESRKTERDRLFSIIEELVLWENSTKEDVIEKARVEIRRSYSGVVPSIYDPFAGGGAIPFEAQRLGANVYASDLNPVASLINKSMIDFPVRFGDTKPAHPGPYENIYYQRADGLSEDINYYGRILRDIVWKKINRHFPNLDSQSLVQSKKNVIAWVWTRTVPSPDPAFASCNVPIASTFLLCSKKGREAWIELDISPDKKSVKYRVLTGSNTAAFEKAAAGTKSGRGANFVCPLSGAAITPEYIKKVGSTSGYGYDLMAIVAEGNKGRVYCDPLEGHSDIAKECQPSSSPYLSLPKHPQYMGVGGYGYNNFSELFTRRQLLVLEELCNSLEQLREIIELDAVARGFSNDTKSLDSGGSGAKAYAEAISVYLSFAIDKLADYNNSLCAWNHKNENISHLFNRHAIPMMWDFVEANPFGSMLDFGKLCDSVAGGLAISGFGDQGSAFQADAVFANCGNDKPVISTDPPYYDNVPYADISDFFYIWLKKSNQSIFPEIFSTISVPKNNELVADRVRHGDASSADAFFLDGMTRTLSNFIQIADEETPVTIYYAFKQSEIEEEGISSTGWATFLEAVISSGFSINATWPVRTERTVRMRAIGSNALANSVVLVCRAKSNSSEVITKQEFIRALKRELPAAIKDLQLSNIAPADMPQSAVGPGMGVFSRYKAVLESDDNPMSIKVALQLINRELGEHLEGIQGEFDADTRFAITWLEQNGLKAGDYGTANNIATARGISVESVKHAGIVESQAGKVRVLRRDELDDKWEPGNDQHLTIWECLQHLVRLHEKDGISHATAVLLKKIGDKAEAVKDLAYILYDISANKRQDAKEATAYNALIADWTELSRQAASNLDTRGNLQQRLDL
jgi:putative DNA methylase